MVKSSIIVFLLLAFLAGAAGADRLLPITGRETVTDQLQSPGVAKCFTTGRARENLLGLERDTPFALPKAAIPDGVVDTITILAIRVDFTYEEPDDPMTTGRGTFDLRDTATFLAEEGYALDPAPHNKHYFEAQLRSLTQFWWVTSNEKLQLVYEVWPKAADSAYHLNKTIGHYGVQNPSFGLGEFFHDALNAAYNADGDSIQFRDERGKKKAIMIFHAGADRQTDLSFSATPTPYDLYTGFLTFDAENQVELGSDTVVEGTIMPETMSQDNRVTCMNAVMAHEFGHQLGLVDLYNTGSVPFLTQLGDFALMDNMGMNTAAYIGDYGIGAFGTVPVFPMAWSRAYLGFEDVAEYRKGTSIELAAVKMRTTGTRVVKIPITSTEYYLLENRRSDLDGSVGLRQDSTSNVILWPARRDGDSIMALPEYDLYLPLGSSGIAIWHIDDMVAQMDYFPFDGFSNNFDANTLQWDPNRRFISLVEADGLIDFGGNYHAGYGTPQDLFYAGNNSTFGTFTNPPTISNDGAYTHINVSRISRPDMVMTFDLGQDKMASGFPRRVSIPTDPTLSPIAADLNGDGHDEIIAVSGKHILAMRADGKSYIDPDGLFDTLRANIDTIFSAIERTTESNATKPVDTTYELMPVFADVTGQITTSPIVATFDDTTLVLVGNSSGWIYRFLPYDSAGFLSNNGRAKMLPPRVSTVDGAVRAIVPDTAAQRNIIHVFYESGKLISASWTASGVVSQYAYGFNGTFAGICKWRHGMAFVYEQGDHSTLFITRDVSLDVIVDSFLVDAVTIPDVGFHPPVATDFDRDGRDEVALVTRQGHIYAYTVDEDGAQPYTNLTGIHTGDTAAAAPTVGDFTNDGYPELIIPGTNRLHGYDRKGLIVTDFPIDIDYSRPGQLVISRPIISDVNGDQTPDITVATLDSIVRSRTVIGYYYEYPDTINFPDSFIVHDTIIAYNYYNYYSSVYVVTPDQRWLAGFPLPAGTFGIRHPGDTVIGMATALHVKDGERGLLVTTGADGWLTAWRCGWSAGSAYWPMAASTADGSGYLSLGVLGEERALSEFLPEDNFFAYPNPAGGRQTTIRFYVNQAADVRVTIFDALGDKVWESATEVVDGNAVAEVPWDISQVASGVYHCRLEATALTGSESKVAFKSIAIVK